MSTRFKLWRNCLFSFLFGTGIQFLFRRVEKLGDSLIVWAANIGAPHLLEWILLREGDVNSTSALGIPLAATMISSNFPQMSFEEENHMSSPPYDEHDICDIREHLCKGRTQACINILVQNGARTQQFF